MQINGKTIANKTYTYLKNQVKKNKLKPNLVVFSVKPKDQDLSFIKSKKNAVKKIGADFTLINYKKTPRFEEFAKKIRAYAGKKSTTAIIIQKPLPSSLDSITLYNYIPQEKEIEGHKKKPLFIPPISQAVLTIAKYVYYSGNNNPEKFLFNLDEDIFLIKSIFKKKYVVIIGRGETGGKPIGQTFSGLKINYININSKTPSPKRFFKQADYIITCVGKKIINPDDLKKGVFLIGVGIRKEAGKWQGDYDSLEIKDIASFYTPTPGGVGPVDIACLMRNLVQSAMIQKNSDL